MLFNSFDFILFYLIVLVVYYIPFIKKFQSILLVLASFFFYAYNVPYLLGLLVVSLLINSLSSYYIFYGNFKRPKLISAAGVIINLGILSFFKYSPFIVDNFMSNNLNDKDSIASFLITIPLPIGISFYTFQGVSLLVDTFRDKELNKNTIGINKNLFKHILDSSLYVSFFPQLIAGPIVKSTFFMPQIKTKFFEDVNWEYVFKMLIIGYFLKIVIADNMKDITAFMQYPYFTTMSTGSLLSLVLAYNVQLFGDFAGYSIIALGLAASFGYTLEINFDFPFIAKNLSEYWRRWHITLYAWFNEYLYNPFVFRYRMHARKAVIGGLFLVFALSGFWHGASWNYLIWGIVHGVVLILEIQFLRKIKVKETWYSNLLKRVVVFTFIAFCLILIKIQDFSEILHFLKCLFTNGGIEQSKLKFESYIFIYTLPVFLYHGYYLLSDERKTKINKFQPIVFAIMLWLIIVNSGFANEFIYFQF